MRRGTVFLCILAVFPFARAAGDPAPAERLIGHWKLHRVAGGDCARHIADLRYTFAANGDYSVKTVMRRIGGLNNENAAGRYEVSGSTATAYVEGHTIGPIPFRFEDGFLVLEQLTPRCDIFLSRYDPAEE